MTRRYLFGPITADFAAQNLQGPRARGECLTFGYAEADIQVGAADTWEAVVSRLPANWRPDFLAVYLGYRTLPSCVWEAPVPLAGLAPDGPLQWHWYRRVLAALDVALTDTGGVEALRREGLSHARAANLFGCERPFLEAPAPDGPRDVDLLL